jgi:hypothetical protein
VLFAAAYAVALFTTFGSFLRVLYSNADVVAAPYIAQLLPAAPGSAEVVLGNVPWYETLWFEWLTRALPYHRVVWEVAPWLGSLLGIGLIAWATAKVAGRWAGMIVAVVLACAGPPLLGYQFAGSIHAPAWLHVAVLGAFLVLVAERGRVHPLLWAGLALVTAAGVASDNLVIVAGVAPFVLAASILGRRSFGAAIAVAIGSVAGARAIGAEMHAAHIRGEHFPIHVAALDRLEPNARIMAHAMLYLFNGDVHGHDPSARWLLGVGCAVVLGAGVLAAVFWGLSPFSRGLSRSTRSVHVAFWGLSAVLTAGVFLFSTLPVNRYSGRYLLSVGYAIPVLVAVGAAASARARAVVALAACVLVVGSTTAIAARDLQSNQAKWPTRADALRLLDFAEAHHLRYGYAGYWDAAALTWETKGRIEVYPVNPCGSGPGICWFPLHRISSWYTPRPATRTFFVVDPAQPTGLEGFLPRLGPPEDIVRVGRLTVYVFPYDIASRFRRA